MGLLLLLILWIAAPALFFVLFILPFQLMFKSFVDLIHIPGQIVAIATNPRLRRNHALEHATINVLESKYGANKLRGLSQDNGYYIQGCKDRLILEKAALEALYRLQHGEEELAIHDRCGTSQAVANLSFAVMYLIVLFAGGQLNLTAVVLGGLALVVFSPVLGIWIQKTLTTSSDIQGFTIRAISPIFSKRNPRFPFISFFGGAPEGFYVYTDVYG